MYKKKEERLATDLEMKKGDGTLNLSDMDSEHDAGGIHNVLYQRL